MWRHGRDIWGGQAEKCVISYPFACFWCQMGGYKQRRGEREKGRVIRGTVLWNLRYKLWRAGSCLSKGAVKGHWDSACCLLAVPCARRCWPPRFPSPLPHPYTVFPYSWVWSQVELTLESKENWLHDYWICNLSTVFHLLKTQINCKSREGGGEGGWLAWSVWFLLGSSLHSQNVI